MAEEINRFAVVNLIRRRAVALRNGAMPRVPDPEIDYPVRTAFREFEAGALKPRATDKVLIGSDGREM